MAPMPPLGTKLRRKVLGAVRATLKPLFNGSGCPPTKRYDPTPRQCASLAEAPTGGPSAPSWVFISVCQKPWPGEACGTTFQWLRCPWVTPRPLFNGSGEPNGEVKGQGIPPVPPTAPSHLWLPKPMAGDRRPLLHAEEQAAAMALRSGPSGDLSVGDEVAFGSMSCTLP